MSPFSARTDLARLVFRALPRWLIYLTRCVSLNKRSTVCLSEALRISRVTRWCSECLWQSCQNGNPSKLEPRGTRRLIYVHGDVYLGQRPVLAGKLCSFSSRPALFNIRSKETCLGPLFVVSSPRLHCLPTHAHSSRCLFLRQGFPVPVFKCLLPGARGVYPPSHILREWLRSIKWHIS